MPLSDKLKKIIAWAAKRHAPPLLDKPSRAQIEELRARQAKRESGPLSEKAKLDLATLEALDATKH
jgi:hypothetical protein